MPSPPSVPSVPRRRNGRPQACEPCRSRKVGCDHQLPVCSGCRRRRIEHKCLYVVAGNPTMPPRSRERTSTFASPRINSAWTLHPPHSSGDVTRPTQSVRYEDLGYMGATSFSTDLQEAQRRLLSLPGAEGYVDVSSAQAEPTQEEPSLSASDFTPPLTAISILRRIPDRVSSYYLFDSYRNIHDTWCRLAARWLLESLWDTFGPVLEVDRSDTALSVIAKQLCLNTAHAIREDHTDPRAWFSEFSGANMRWESIGILFSYWSSGLLSLPRESFKDSCTALKDMDRRVALNLYQESVADCSNLCWHMGNGNSLLCCLLFQRILLQYNIYGDTDIRPFRLHGDLAALTTYLGLHTSNAPFNDRSISVQIRRRLFAGVFYIDKAIATFTGRPPLLSQRFISQSAPLDICDEELLQVTSSPNVSPFNGVNEEGWSRGSIILSTSPLRARLMMAYLRDSILEIALRSPLLECEAPLLDLKQQAIKVYEGFPPILKYTAKDLQNSALEHIQVYSRLQVRLEHLHNIFFIERLLSKLREEVTAELVRISLEIIDLSLLPFTNRHLTTGIMCDIDWVIMGHGARAGGNLCMELLRPATALSGTSGVSKSAMVQSLSMLVGCLNAVPKDAPNYQVGATIKRIIEQVLDRVLDPPAEVTTQELSVEGWETNFLVDTNDLFNSNLLDTFDWFRP